MAPKKRIQKPATKQTSKPSEFRIEHDSMGELRVPAAAFWGAQTQRALDNFHISGEPMPQAFLRALAQVKEAAAEVNAQLGLLDAPRANAIAKAAQAVSDGEYAEQFPIDRYQPGSGTSTNMNANEVIARIAAKSAKLEIHPNDHVNLGQSSNDVIPTTIRVMAAIEVQRSLLPALSHLQKTIATQSKKIGSTVKTGRTHLMDAMPLSFAQEFGAWSAQLASAEARIRDSLQRVVRLPIGGTAIGTGINAHPKFGAGVARTLAKKTGMRFAPASNTFEGIAAQDDVVELSGQFSVLAVALMKIGNDLRWMNSGPLAGLGEIELPALQPGSSIMPGKVNPVIPEALCMVCAQVIGLHQSVTIAGQSGNFQLNVMLPLLACNVEEAIRLLANAMRALADKAMAKLRVRQENVASALDKNPILVTALNPVIGYEKAAQIAKRAYAEKRPVFEVARKMSDLSDAELRQLLNPAQLTRGGIKKN